MHITLSNLQLQYIVIPAVTVLTNWYIQEGVQRPGLSLGIFKQITSYNLITKYMYKNKSSFIFMDKHGKILNEQKCSHENEYAGSTHENLHNICFSVVCCIVYHLTQYFTYRITRLHIHYFINFQSNTRLFYTSENT